MGPDAAIEVGIDHFGRTFEPYLGAKVNGSTEAGKLLGEFLGKQKRRRITKLWDCV